MFSHPFISYEIDDINTFLSYDRVIRKNVKNIFG